MIKLSDFSYELPEEKIAKYPPDVRGQSRLLVVDRTSESLDDRAYRDLPDYIQPGDLVVLNDTKVLPARIIVYTSAGRKIELVLQESHRHELELDSLAKFIYRGRLKVGESLHINLGSVHNSEQSEGKQVEMIVERLENTGVVGIAAVKLTPNSSIKNWSALIRKFGEPPIPPYLQRKAEAIDLERYQTVFAQNQGAVAAPTASLNFTESVLDKLIAKGVSVNFITLHVGLGTFLPIRTDDLSQHKMHQEYYEIPQPTLENLEKVRSTGKKVWAIGTTVTRCLEYASSKGFQSRGEADIFIYPGYKFQVVDHLLTNFHAPKSTVLMLTAAFTGWDLLYNAYQHALFMNYRFLSYGDSMLIV